MSKEDIANLTREQVKEFKVADIACFSRARLSSVITAKYNELFPEVPVKCAELRRLWAKTGDCIEVELLFGDIVQQPPVVLLWAWSVLLTNAPLDFARFVHRVMGAAVLNVFGVKQ